MGIHTIPVCYGLTCGEVAGMMNEELGIGCDLRVVPCDGLTREMDFRDWGHYWTMTSPNIPRYETVLLYPGTCLIEGTNLSEGRGTADPFAIIGAPYIRAEEFSRAFNLLNCPGVVATPVPVQVEGMQKTLASGAFTIALMNVSDVSNTARAYLDHYVSGSPDNYGQHHSNAYDILLRAAAASDSVEARDAYLADAERLLLESGYVIPLCTGSYRYLLRSTLTGLLHQDMGVYNFSAVTEIPVA